MCRASVMHTTSSIQAHGFPGSQGYLRDFQTLLGFPSKILIGLWYALLLLPTYPARMLYNSHNLFFFFFWQTPSRKRLLTLRKFWIRSKKLSPWEWGFPENLQSNNGGYLGTGLERSSSSVLTPPEAARLLVFPMIVGVFKASMALWRGDERES